MMPGVIVWYCDAAHAGGVCGQDSFFGIFQYDAFLRPDAKIMGRFKKNVRSRFNRGHIQTAHNDIKKMRHVKAYQYAVDGVAVGRRSERKPDLAMQCVEQLERTVHRT